MKKRNQIKSWTQLCLGGAALLGLTLFGAGCATRGTMAMSSSCSQCQVVLFEPVGGLGSRVDSFLSRDNWVGHQCPGCQSALTTLMREGQFKSKCVHCDEAAATYTAQR